VPILFFIGGFHFDHLYKWHVTLIVIYCMITKLINKWMFTFCKYNCYSLTLCLPYAKLTSYSTGYVQISNDTKLNMIDGAYQDFRGPYPRHPPTIYRTWAWSSPTWQCTTSTTSIVSQPGTTAGDVEWPHEEVDWEQRASWSWTPATSTSREGFFVFELSGNPPASLCRCDWPLRGRQLASYHGV
jgi:hypothetical protein